MQLLPYILRRLAVFFPMLLATSLLAFLIIQLPPGDAVTTLNADLAAAGQAMSDEEVAAMRARLGLDQPILVQYAYWIGNVVRGDLGMSLEHRTPVADLIGARMGMTAFVSLCTLLFIWLVSLPIGIISAVRQNSWIDYTASTIGFIGLATPNFVLALALMYANTEWFGSPVGGLFSPEFVQADWSYERVIDMLKKLWVPVLVLGTAGMAALIRVMRANLLDELKRPYVDAARARGLSEGQLIVKYPVRLALSPFVATIAWILPALISGELIVSSVLSLPTAGPLLLQALKSQDVYLSGAIFLFVCAMVLVGTLISDILLGVLDPRVRRS